jgi:phosphoglycolate phosphatase-like HAD superfamily hydrolase
MMNRLDRPWDRFDAYLFDIDGTLIHCTDAIHYFAFCDVLTTLVGREVTLEGVTTHGNVDNGILRDALERAGVLDGGWRARLPEIHRTMAEFVEARRDEVRPTVLPQVREVLEHLRDSGARLGVATGNLERIGRVKLERAGLMGYFNLGGGWSDAHDSRAEVFCAAVAKVRAACGAATSICVLGDTPADIAAGRANDLPVIAVATGIYSFKQLSEEQPGLCLHSFSDLVDASART